MSDQGFREIQLSGKQLIALFMAAAVVLIATFLSGVLVGRGVRAQLEPSNSGAALQNAAGEVDPTASPASQRPSPSPEPPPLMPSAAAPPTPEEGPATDARGQAAPGQAEAVTAQPAAAEAKPVSKPVRPPAGAAPTGGEPPGEGFYVKVVAYRGKAQADRVAALLSGKGYSAWVSTVPTKGATLYSVRVGKYATRQEAEAARRRLEQEEQFKPSIAR